MASQPLLSIIITSYTTERINDIYELLDSIKAQAYPNIETIFVAERTQELIDRIGDYANRQRIPNLKLLFNDGEPGLSAARNVGVGEARGDIIAFIDDDVVLLPDWAEEIVKAYTDDSVIGVTGPASPLWEDESMSWFPEEFYWIISCTAWCDWKETTEVRNAWGMNMSFRREAFEKAGNFIPRFGLCNSSRAKWADPPSEDVDLSLRAKSKTGKRIIYSPDAAVRHRVYAHRIKQRFVMQRAYSVGYQRRMIKRLYPDIKDGDRLLNQEHRLLKRILGRLFPDILKNLFVNPVIAWRKSWVTFTALTFVALGYYSHLLPNFKRKQAV